MTVARAQSTFIGMATVKAGKKLLLTSSTPAKMSSLMRQPEGLPLPHCKIPCYSGVRIRSTKSLDVVSYQDVREGKLLHSSHRYSSYFEGIEIMWIEVRVSWLALMGSKNWQMGQSRDM